MGRVDDLRRLAFDGRFPSALTSDVAKRTIRLNRLRLALGAAAHTRNYDAIVDLLVELSSVVAVDERGKDYLLAHPDLVVGFGRFGSAPSALRVENEVAGCSARSSDDRVFDRRRLA